MADNFFRYSPIREENEYIPNGPIQNTADVIKAMSSPLYKSDPAYRAAVQRCMLQAQEQGHLQNLDPSTQTLESRMAGNGGAAIEFVKEQKEALISMIGDKRYKESATYRKAVAEFIAKSDPRHVQDIGGTQRYDAPSGETPAFDPSKPSPEGEWK